MGKYEAYMILIIDGKKFEVPISVNVSHDERIMGYIVRPAPIRYFMSDEYGAVFVSDEERIRYERRES